MALSAEGESKAMKRRRMLVGESDGESISSERVSGQCGIFRRFIWQSKPLLAAHCCLAG